MIEYGIPTLDFFCKLTYLSRVTRRDYYDILDVRPTATLDELKRAYRARARKLHVDGQPLPGFSELAQAYAVLGDPEQRRAYDRSARGESIMDLLQTPVGIQALELQFGGRPVDLLPGPNLRMLIRVPKRTLELGGIVDVTLPPDSVRAGEVFSLTIPLNSMRRRFVMLPGLGMAGEHIADTGAKGALGTLFVLLIPS